MVPRLEFLSLGNQFVYKHFVYLSRKQKLIIWKLQIDMVSIHEEMVIAIEVMDEIEDVIIKFLPRVSPLYLYRSFS